LQESTNIETKFSIEVPSANPHTIHLEQRLLP